MTSIWFRGYRVCLSFDYPSDLVQAAVAVEVIERYVPQLGDGLGPDALQLHADELADLAEVSEYQLEDTGYLLFARCDVPWIQVANLEVGEQLLARRCVISIGPSGHHRDVERLEGLLAVVTSMIRGIINDNDAIVPPVLVLRVENSRQPEHECFEYFGIDRRLADRKVDLAKRIHGGDQGKPVTKVLGAKGVLTSSEGPGLPDEESLVHG